ncbi:glycosyltransferase family 2 protein [soil metagenome]
MPHLLSPQLSIVVPVYNEEPSNLRNLLARLAQVLEPTLIFYEVIFVDDGSRSQANEACRALVSEFEYVKLVVLSRNFGELAAICAGLDHSCGEAVINMDSDLQDPPELIPTMLQYWREGYDVVFTRQASRKESWFRQFLAFAFYRILNAFSSVNIPVDAGEFRLLSRRAVEALCAAPEKTKFFRALVPWVGFKQMVIPFDRSARSVGQSSYSVKKLIKLAVEGLISFNMQPLYFVPILGLSIIVLSLFESLFASGSPSAVFFGMSLGLISFLTFLTGLQISCMGLLAMCLAEVLKETRGRPTYIVGEKIGFERREETSTKESISKSAATGTATGAASATGAEPGKGPAIVELKARS